MNAARERKWSQEAALAAAAFVAMGAFLGLSRVIQRKRATRFDTAIVRAFGRARSPIANMVGVAVTTLGSVPGASVITASALVLARKKPRFAAQIMIGAVGGIIAELGMKRFFHRQRPTLLEHLEEVASSSFPSGHAMASASLYLTLAFVASHNKSLRARRAELLTSGGALALTVSASRVFLGVHWPTDVLGGYALGIAWACLAEAAFDLTAAEQAEQACAPSVLASA